MRYYQPNPACGCGRCSTRGLMGPAVLVTLGLLFLLGNMTDYSFDRTWPILLIVIGAVNVARYVMPNHRTYQSWTVPAAVSGSVCGELPRIRLSRPRWRMSR